MLTHEVADKTSYIRRFMDVWLHELPDTSRAINVRLKSLPSADAVYASPVEYMIAGTAADYRIRAAFDPQALLSPLVLRGIQSVQAPTSAGRLVDGEMVHLNNPWHSSPIAENFVRALETQCASRRSDPERLARFCYLVANLDAFARAPLSAPRFLWRLGDADAEVMLAAVPAAAAQDIADLAAGYLDRTTTPQSVTIGASPEGAPDVGGADFDFVLDGTLVDLKAMRTPRVKTDHLRQLAGYWLLDYGDAFGIRTVVLELLRQRHAERLDVAGDLLRTSDPLEVRRLFHAGVASGRVPPVDPALKLDWGADLVLPDGTIIPDTKTPRRNGRGRPPLFGRAMTSKEATRRLRALKGR